MRCLVVSLKLPPFKKFFLGVAFPYCTSFDHETKLAVLIAQAKAKSGSDLKFPRDLLTTSSACNTIQCADWLATCGKHARDSVNCHGTRVLCYTTCPVIILFTFSFCFAFLELDRFHHEKDFTYNYEGETVSSVVGASSARSGLRIRARCVVKSVAPCQHVLKVRQLCCRPREKLDISHI